MQEALADVEVKTATLKQATREWERVKHFLNKTLLHKKERDSALSAFEMAQASLKSISSKSKKLK